jgi:hypothetical protein
MSNRARFWGVLCREPVVSRLGRFESLDVTAGSTSLARNLGCQAYRHGQRRILANRKSVAAPALHLLDVCWLPTLVEGGFGRAVEPEDDEIPLARHSCSLVAGLARGCFGAEVNVRAAVVILRRLVARSPATGTAGRWRNQEFQRSKTSPTPVTAAISSQSVFDRAWVVGYPPCLEFLILVARHGEWLPAAIAQCILVARIAAAQ